jgi:hypothetical protein
MSSYASRPGLRRGEPCPICDQPLADRVDLAPLELSMTDRLTPAIGHAHGQR